jgi:hypothetical protein
MPKPQFQDIVPPDRRSIKKIPIPERQRVQPPPQPQFQPAPPPRPERPLQAPQAPERIVRPAQPVSQERYSRPIPPAPQDRFEEIPTPRFELNARQQPLKKRRSKLGIFIVLLILVGAGYAGYTYMSRMAGATVTIIPKGEQVAVDAQFSASLDTVAALPYQVSENQKDGKLTVPASGEEFAQVKASGGIRIFNNFSTAPQVLVANTRFETPDGKIFRISQPVTIPGKTGDTPGSIDALVTADKVGAEYNVGMVDFTIPGYKGDERFTKIFARSVNKIEGGFSGMRNKVDPAIVAEARAKIRQELETSLVRQMEQNIPSEFIFPKNAYFIQYESLPDMPTTDGVQLSERAVFYGIMFKRADLAKAISAKAQGDTQRKYDLFGTENLIFAANVGSTSKPWESNPLPFTLKGTTTIVSAIDIDMLKSALAAQPRNSLTTILAGYPGISKAEVVMRPFWQRAFPADPKDIVIEVASSPSTE